jgi:hypothetical protein
LYPKVINKVLPCYHQHDLFFQIIAFPPWGPFHSILFLDHSNLLLGGYSLFGRFVRSRYCAGPLSALSLARPLPPFHRENILAENSWGIATSVGYSAQRIRLSPALYHPSERWIHHHLDAIVLRCNRGNGDFVRCDSPCSSSSSSASAPSLVRL